MRKKQKKTEDVGKIQENAEKCGKQEMAENRRIWQGKGGEMQGKGRKAGKCGKRQIMVRKKQVYGKSRKRLEKGRKSFL